MVDMLFIIYTSYIHILDSKTFRKNGLEVYWRIKVSLILKLLEITMK
jgi:hypothetical protein